LGGIQVRVVTSEETRYGRPRRAVSGVPLRRYPADVHPAARRELQAEDLLAGAEEAARRRPAFANSKGERKVVDEKDEPPW